TTGVEHPAVSDTLGRWERAGAARVITVPPGPHGRVDAERVLAAVDSGTCAVAMIAANNETGVCQPVAEVAAALAGGPVRVHTDAVQWVARRDLSFRAWALATAAISGHKLGA